VRADKVGWPHAFPGLAGHRAFDGPREIGILVVVPGVALAAPGPGPFHLHLRIQQYSADGKTWERFSTRMEVSGYHHNVMYDFLSLRPAIYAAGTGEVRFRKFTYRALP
jgi:hypothetical protein